MVRVVGAVGLAGVEQFVPRFGLANGGDALVVFAGHQRVILARLQQQAPIGLGQLALHGEGFLRHLAPAQLGQQRADKGVFQLRLAAPRQRSGRKVLRQPRRQSLRRAGLRQLAPLLRNKAIVQQRIDQPRVGEKVLHIAVSRQCAAHRF